MTAQRDLEVTMLAILYARFHRGSAPVTVGALKKIIYDQMRISDFRFQDAFDNLLRWNYLKSELGDGQDTKYRLSRRGVDWFEGWYRLEDGPDSKFTYYRRHKGVVMVDELHWEFEKRKKESHVKNVSNFGTFFWTKWGAVAAISAIPVALIVWYFN